jgi:hypothetical protein
MEIPTTQQETKQSNTMVYILISIIVILLGYIGYVYTSNDMVKKGKLKSDYVLKSAIEFDMLPEYIKGKYINFYEHNSKINELNYKLQSMERNTGKSVEPKIIEKIVEVEKIVKVPVEKIVEVERIMAVPIEVQAEENEENEENSISLTSKSFDTFTCKNLEEGSIKITPSCLKRLHNFLDDNKNAKKYEVIGMVDNTDFKFITKLKDVYGAKKVKDLSKYSQIGLARQRVIEASWVIKEYMGDYKNIKTVNYTINTENKKGFVVRAYK